MIADPNIYYEALKFWLPVVTGFVLVFKAYKAVTGSVATYADKLLSNHLTHIQTATTETVAETRRTNSILADSAKKTEYIATKIDDHAEKEGIVWQGVVNTLAVLEDRTRRSRTPRASRKR